MLNMQRHVSLPILPGFFTGDHFCWQYHAIPYLAEEILLFDPRNDPGMFVFFVYVHNYVTSAFGIRSLRDHPGV